MIILGLFIIGILFGSFVNALVWRVHEQELEVEKKKPNKKYLRELSITKGRSMCPACKHELSAKDLLPIVSWLSLKGKCRYCKKPISEQYPIAELFTGLLIMVSYVYWPNAIHGVEIVLYGLWGALVVGFVALSVYDLKWFLLPNRILFPLFVPGLTYAVIVIAQSSNSVKATLNTLAAVLIGGGIFYLLYQISSGRWIGGGDVKLGWLLGLIAGTPARALLFIFLASLLGTVVSLPLLYSKRLKKDHIIPFGPFLMAGLFIVQIWGASILDWYTRTFINL